MVIVDKRSILEKRLVGKNSNHFILNGFSTLALIIIKIRNEFYNRRFFKIKKLTKPVISIGNIRLGGTGKTPLTILISEYFINKGLKVAVLSRGYGGKKSSRVPYLVSDGHEELRISPYDCGEEAWMIAKRIPQAIVAIGKDKYSTGTFVINSFNPDLIVIDDGFQHRKLHRDIDIVIDPGFADILCEKIFPAGYLREPIDSLTRADLLIQKIQNGQDQNGTLVKEIKNRFISTLKKKDKYLLKKLNEKHFFYACYNIPGQLEKIGPLYEKIHREYLKEDEFAVLSAIGNHSSFEKLIQNAGLKIGLSFRFTDHHYYSLKDLLDIKTMMKKHNIHKLITTEKDAVKLLSEKICDFIDVFLFSVNFSIVGEKNFFPILEKILFIKNPYLKEKMNKES